MIPSVMRHGKTRPNVVTRIWSLRNYRHIFHIPEREPPAANSEYLQQQKAELMHVNEILVRRKSLIEKIYSYKKNLMAANGDEEPDIQDPSGAELQQHVEQLEKLEHEHRNDYQQHEQSQLQAQDDQQSQRQQHLQLQQQQLQQQQQQHLQQQQQLLQQPPQQRHQRQHSQYQYQQESIDEHRMRYLRHPYEGPWPTVEKAN